MLFSPHLIFTSLKFRHFFFNREINVSREFHVIRYFFLSFLQVWKEGFQRWTRGTSFPSPPDIEDDSVFYDSDGTNGGEPNDNMRGLVNQENERDVLKTSVVRTKRMLGTKVASSWIPYQALSYAKTQYPGTTFTGLPWWAAYGHWMCFTKPRESSGLFENVWNNPDAL